MIVWAHAVLGVLYIFLGGGGWGVGGLYLHLFSAIEHVSHGKAL